MGVEIVTSNLTIQEAITTTELAVNYLKKLILDSSVNDYLQVVEASKKFTSSPTLPRYRKQPRKPGEVGATKVMGLSLLRVTLGGNILKYWTS